MKSGRNLLLLHEIQCLIMLSYFFSIKFTTILNFMQQQEVSTTFHIPKIINLIRA